MFKPPWNLKRIVWALVATALLSLLGGVKLPRILVWLNNYVYVGPAIVACGPRAIPAVVDGVRTTGYPLVADIRIVLAHFGPAARPALLTAIDETSDPRERGNLIVTLQRNFYDFSRFDLWLADYRDGPLISKHVIDIDDLFEALDYHQTYVGDISWPVTELSPGVYDDSSPPRISPEFLDWWSRWREKILAFSAMKNP